MNAPPDGALSALNVSGNRTRVAVRACTRAGRSHARECCQLNRSRICAVSVRVLREIEGVD